MEGERLTWRRLYSIWVFFLLGMEGIRTYKTNPNLVIATYNIPTWITPLVMVLFIEALVPGTSFIGHLCAVGTGYTCKLSTALLVSS